MKMEAPVQVCSCEFCKMFMNTYFEKNLRTAPTRNRFEEMLLQVESLEVLIQLFSGTQLNGYICFSQESY